MFAALSLGDGAGATAARSDAWNEDAASGDADRMDARRAVERVRVVMPGGAFLVYDAAVPADRPRKQAGFLAYWNQFETDELFVYGRLLTPAADVGHALLALEADFGVDTVLLTSADPTLRRAMGLAGEQAPDDTDWLLADRWTMLWLMGFDPGDEMGLVALEGNDPVAACCQINDTCCAQSASIIAEHLDPPPRDAGPDDVIAGAMIAGRCCSTGGGGGGGGGDHPLPPRPPCGNATCGCDRCCSGSNCCESPDSCCEPNDCCGNPNRCCNPDNPCCESPDPCCNREDDCCGNPNRCCNDDNPCCGSTDPCCNPLDPCCESEDPCCNPDNPCCEDPCRCVDCDDGNRCTRDTCENGECSYPLEPDGTSCPPDADPCTRDKCQGGVCTHPPKCEPGQHCCVNGTCCDEVCDGCVDYGSLSGGRISGTQGLHNLGEWLEFWLGSYVIDSGGSRRLNCEVMPIAPSTPLYRWNITRPDGNMVYSFDLFVTVYADQAGVYSITCTAMAPASRLCPPVPLTLGPRTVTVIKPDMQFEDVPDEDEEDPGGYLCLNDDDDNANGVPDKDDSGAVAGEDDLRTLTISLPAAESVAGTLTLSCEAGCGRVKFYEDADRSGPVTLPFSWDLPSTELPETLYVEGYEASGSARDVTLKLAYEDESQRCWWYVLKLTVLDHVDLDGDGDHNGAISVDGADDWAEWDLPGVIVLCNADDDNADGVRDQDDAAVNGTADVDDLAPVVLRAVEDLPEGWGARLTLHSPSNAGGAGADDIVRVFSRRAVDAVPILGPGVTTFTLPEDAAHDVDLAALRAGDIMLGVEGLEFAAEVRLKVELLDDAGQPAGCEDEIQLKVAPLILLGHLDSPTQSFVSQVTWEPAKSAAYCTQRFPNATPPGVTDTIIQYPYNSGNDPWAQDEFQIGYQDAPYGNMYVVLDSKRDRGLAPFPPSLLGPGFGRIQISDPQATTNSLDYFGNLEVSPPCLVEGTPYPLGRVYYGDGGDTGRQMDPDLRDFLARQQVQLPVTLNSDWLLVGHVDEFMSIVPNPYATHGWSVLLADPVLALDILSGDALVLGGVDEKLHIHRYADYQVEQLGALLGRMTSDGSMTIEQYNTEGGPVDLILGGLEWDISDGLGLIFSQDMYRVPVLFNYVDDPGGLGTGAVAMTPDLVNGSVYGTVLIAPDPFLHGFSEEDTNTNWRLDAGEDASGDYMLDTLRDPFQVWLNQNMPPGMEVQYIDDWLLYHLSMGEVHCSSNEQRLIPSSPNWWDSTP